MSCVRFTKANSRRLSPPGAPAPFPAARGGPRSAAAPQSSPGYSGGRGGPASSFQLGRPAGSRPGGSRPAGSRPGGSRRPRPGEEPGTPPSLGRPAAAAALGARRGRRCAVATRSLKATSSLAPGSHPGRDAQLPGGGSGCGRGGPFATHPWPFCPLCPPASPNVQGEQPIDLFDFFFFFFFCTSGIFCKRALCLLKIER